MLHQRNFTKETQKKKIEFLTAFFLVTKEFRMDSFFFLFFKSTMKRIKQDLFFFFF